MEKSPEQIKREASFEKLWEEEISPALGELATEKKKERLSTIGLWGIMITILGFFGVVDNVDSYPNTYSVILLFAIPIILITFFVFLIKKTKNNYSEGFRGKIFDVILKNTKFDWRFESDTEKVVGGNSRSLKRFKGLGISSSYKSLFLRGNNLVVDVFKGSNLYSSFDEIDVDEVITSKYNNVQISASEVCATKIKKQNKQEKKATVFQGFFIEIQFSRSFDGETYVMTEGDDNYLVGGYKMDINNIDIKETELEWNDFEKFLKVRSNNQIEAREIFAPDFMAVIYDWWIIHKKNLRFAFKGQSIYITIPSSVNFEPTLLATKKWEKQIIKEHLELLWFIEEITEMLLYYNRNKLN